MTTLNTFVSNCSFKREAKQGSNPWEAKAAVPHVLAAGGHVWAGILITWLTGLHVNKWDKSGLSTSVMTIVLSKTSSQSVNPQHPSNFLLVSSPLSTRFFIWPDSCFTLQHVNVKGTSLGSVPSATWIIIWSDVRNEAHVAFDKAVKYILTQPVPKKIWGRRWEEQERGGRGVADKEKHLKLYFWLILYLTNYSKLSSYKALNKT